MSTTENDCEILDRSPVIRLRTENGLNFLLKSYKIQRNGQVSEHALLYKSPFMRTGLPVLTRINSACFTSDIFGCVRCDCNWQLREAMRMIHDKSGLLIYHFNQEGRGIGFTDKLKSISLMDISGKSSADAFRELGHCADERDYRLSAVILKDLKIDQIDLITNNIDKASQLMSYGIHVNHILPLISPEERHSQYLASKSLIPATFPPPPLPRKNCYRGR